MAQQRHTHRTACENRKARHDYFIDETLEAGIVLTGTEVKSLREGRGNLRDSYAGDRDGALWLFGAYIPEYGKAVGFLRHEERRPRKLLLHAREIARLIGAIQREGVTLVPLSIYFNDRGIAKVELGVARGKRKADKRQSEKERDWQREKARVMRDRG
ncbi:MAG: SsrA-binding protein SmpB [Alphaproteobacteria bacterium]